MAVASNAGMVVRRVEPAAASNWWSTIGASVTVTDRIEDVAELWRALEADGIESPGQSLDFVRAWIARFGLTRRDQAYLIGSRAGHPIFLLPLMRTRLFGLKVWTFFGGAHVGCNGPLVDQAALSRMNAAEREALWARMQVALHGADLIYLPNMPEDALAEGGALSGIGRSVPGETLYRARFASWDEADATQRNRSRRKHDKQHAAKLAAMGELAFEVLRDGEIGQGVLDEMFAQRAARFAKQGIEDPFADTSVGGLYADLAAGQGDLSCVMHVLRLDGKMIASRYNLVSGDRMFCLISSMVDCETIQTGAPGKQCLLNVMQTVFDEGVSFFDMGNGLTDEKRQWCNEAIPLRHHYVPLSLKGRAVTAAHGQLQAVKRGIKRNEKLFGLFKRLRALIGR